MPSRARGALLKRVRNTGDATAFVRVQISEVRYAADGTHQEIPVDTSGTAAAAGLIASPSRLIVPAQGQQATRLLVQGDRSVERYPRALRAGAAAVRRRVRADRCAA